MGWADVVNVRMVSNNNNDHRLNSTLPITEELTETELSSGHKKKRTVYNKSRKYENMFDPYEIGPGQTEPDFSSLPPKRKTPLP